MLRMSPPWERGPGAARTRGLQVAESGFGFGTIFCALRSRHLFLVASVVPIAMVTRRHRTGSPMGVLGVLLGPGGAGVGTGLLAEAFGEVAAQCPMSGPSCGFGSQSWDLLPPPSGLSTSGNQT